MGRSTTRTTAYEYDGLSNLTRVTSPAGRVVKIDFDERSIPWRTTRGFGTTEAAIAIVHLDKNGNTTQTIDGEGHATNYIYDRFDRMTSATDALLPSSNKLEITWTKRSQVAERRLFNPGNLLATKAQFTYDELGRRTKRTEVDVNTSSSISESWFEFDKASRLVKTRSPRGFFTQIAYDAANRRTSMTDAIGNSLAWLLDPNGNPLTVTSTEKVPSSPDEVYVVESVFDALDRVQQTRRIDRLNASHQLVTNFGYDGRSNLVSVAAASVAASHRRCRRVLAPGSSLLLEPAALERRRLLRSGIPNGADLMRSLLDSSLRSIGPA
jgi:YD repeat-containing protein